MRNETHVGLVDAHTERNGGYHDQPFLVEEALLVGSPGVAGQAGVIRQGREPLIAEELRDFIDFFTGQAVDDARIAATLRQERQQLLARLLFGHDAIENIGTVEARQKAFGILQMQASDDLFAGALVGRGRQGNSRHSGKHFSQLAQLQVFRAEVVAPLRYAVSFVDGKQGDVQALQKRHHARLHQTLRRKIEHLDFAALDTVGQLALLLGTQGRIQGRRGHPEFFKGRDLVVHQGNQRRYHHGQAIAQQGRHLEAQGLAAAGGHQHQGVATTGHALNNVTLSATETVVAEDVLEYALSLFEHKNSRNRRNTPAQAVSGAASSSFESSGAGRWTRCIHCRASQNAAVYPSTLPRRAL